MEDASSLVAPQPSSDPTTPRTVYEPPTLEALGAWSALTLQQSVPIGPSAMMYSYPMGPAALSQPRD